MSNGPATTKIATCYNPDLEMRGRRACVEIRRDNANGNYSVSLIENGIGSDAVKPRFVATEQLAFEDAAARGYTDVVRA